MVRRTTTPQPQEPRPLDLEPEPDDPTWAGSSIRTALTLIAGVAAIVIVAAVLVLVFRGGNDRREQRQSEREERALSDLTTAGAGYEIIVSINPHSEDTGSGYKLYAVAPDGNGARKLLPGGDDHDPANETYPALSPDGSTLAFSSNRDGDDDIYLWDGSGEPYPITDSTDDERHEVGPRWTHDGSAIRFASFSARSVPRPWVASIDIKTLEIDSGETTGDQLTFWSPDGSKVAGLALGQIRNPPNAMTSTMWLADGDGSNEMQISDFPTNSVPDWFPDGSQFIFAGDNMVYVVNRDGTDLHPISDPSLAARNARRSPDGGSIAVAGVNPETGFAALYLIAPDGSDVRLLVEQRSEIDQLAWSPDGRQIAYVTDAEISGGTPTYDDVTWALHVIDADGSDDRELATDVHSNSEPIWRPAGGSDPATAVVPPTATLPASGEEIDLPEQVRTVQSGGVKIRLVTAGDMSPMTFQQAMEIVAAEFPWGNGGEWEGKPISIRAWYGIGTLTDLAPEPITDRPMWVLDYGNVQGIIPSRDPSDTSTDVPNHNVYAVDVETGQLWFAGSYLEAELESGPTPTVPSNYPSPTADPPMEVQIPPIIANIASSGVSLSVVDTPLVFPIAYEEAVARLEDAYPTPDGQVAVHSHGGGLATITAPTWAIIARPMYVLDRESRDVSEEVCPQDMEGFRIICHDIFAVDGVTGEALSVGRSWEQHAEWIGAGYGTESGDGHSTGTPMTDPGMCTHSLLPGYSPWDSTAMMDAPGLPAPIVLRSDDQQQYGWAGRACVEAGQSLAAHDLTTVSYPIKPLHLGSNPEIELDFRDVGTPTAISLAVYDLNQAAKEGKIAGGHAIMWPYSPPAVPEATCCLVHQEYLPPDDVVSAELPLEPGVYAVIMIANIEGEGFIAYTEQGFHLVIDIVDGPIVENTLPDPPPIMLHGSGATHDGKNGHFCLPDAGCVTRNGVPFSGDPLALASGDVAHLDFTALGGVERVVITIYDYDRAVHDGVDGPKIEIGCEGFATPSASVCHERFIEHPAMGQPPVAEPFDTFDLPTDLAPGRYVMVVDTSISGGGSASQGFHFVVE